MTLFNKVHTKIKTTTLKLQHMDRLVKFFVLGAVVLSLHRAQCQGTQCSDVANNTLEFLFMTSFSESLNTSGNAVGMMIALEKINANSSILPDYNLTYSAIVDTQVSRYFAASTTCMVNLNQVELVRQFV